MQTAIQMPHVQIGPNFAEVSIPGVGVFDFSYRTLIGFYHEPTGTKIVRRNVWGPTTGKHLNAIDGGSREAKAARLPGEQFEQRYAELFGVIGS